jgi:hypothetical protein
MIVEWRTSADRKKLHLVGWAGETRMAQSNNSMIKRRLHPKQLCASRRQLMIFPPNSSFCIYVSY